MKYASFYFSNYRGIQSIHIDIGDEQTPIALIGANESGKTTILRAINDMGRHIERGFEQYFKNGDIQEIIPIGLYDFSDNIMLGCAIQDGNSTLHIRCTYHIVDSKLVEYTRKITVDSRELKGDEEKSIAKQIEREAPKIWFYPDFLKKVENTISFVTSRYLHEQEKQHSGASLESHNPAYREAVLNEENRHWQSILDDVWVASQDDKQYTEGIFQQDIVDYPDYNENYQRAYDRKLRAVGACLTDTIIGEWHKIDSQEQKIDRIDFKEKTPEHRHPLFGLSNNSQLPFKTYSFEVVETNETSYSLEERSLGFNWFFSFILYTTFRKARSTNAIFLLDEPAYNLYAPMQKKILTSLDTLAEESTVIYSTHSPYFLSMTNYNTMYNISNPKVGKTSNIHCRKIADTAENERNPIYPLINHFWLELPNIISQNSSEIENIETSLLDTKDKKQKILELISAKMNVNPDVIAANIGKIDEIYGGRLNGLVKTVGEVAEIC